MIDKIFQWRIWEDDHVDSPIFRGIDFDYPESSHKSDRYNLCGFGKGVAVPPQYGRHMIVRFQNRESNLRLGDFNEFPLWWILMSARLQFTIKTFSGAADYQWIEPRFRDKYSKIIGADFKLFNCLKHLKLVNWEFSTTHYYGEDLRIDNLIIDQSKIGGMSGICRLAEDPAFLLVPGKLHERCLGEGICGMRFREVSII